MDDFAEKLEAAMQKHHVHIDGKIDYGSTKFQRFREANHHKRGKNLFVIIHEDGATFGNWRYQEEWITWWYKDYKTLSLQEKRDRELKIRMAAREKELLRADAIYRAKILFKQYGVHPDELHPYIQQKRIRALYARQIRSRLVIPLRDEDYNLVSLQFIKPDGSKRFKQNATPKGAMCWLAEPLSATYSGVIRICEGWATGCTIYEAMGGPVICAMSAGNLPAVSLAIRRKYVHAIIKICADDDQSETDNPGLHYGRMAMQLTGASLYYPDFSVLPKTVKMTDFNDLLGVQGIEVVERQLILIKE